MIGKCTTIFGSWLEHPKFYMVLKSSKGNDVVHNITHFQMAMLKSKIPPTLPPKHKNCTIFLVY